MFFDVVSGYDFIVGEEFVYLVVEFFGWFECCYVNFFCFVFKFEEYVFFMFLVW